MVEHRVLPGGHLGSETVAGMARSVQVIAGDRPSRRHQFQVAGAFLPTPDRKQLVECPATGAYVKVRSIATGAVVTELRPSYRHLGGAPDQGRVFLTPQGQLTLISWDLEGRFFVWDVAGGRLIAQFRASAKPLVVLVHEHLWRLISEVDRKVNVGRYRKDIATVWDLGTGAVLEEMVGEDLHRRYTGYVDRCSTDGFATEAHSPDGRLRAGALQLTGGAAVSLHDAHSDTEVFRSDVTTAERVRAAFSEDGQHLLTCWQGTDQLTSLEIWKV
jgi:molecular chaperone DnaK